MTTMIRSEDAVPQYSAPSAEPMASGPLTPDEQADVDRARQIIYSRLFGHTEGVSLTAPGPVIDFLQLHLATEPDECFAVLYLSNRHQPLDFRIHFRGTIDGATVHPRPVLRRALETNAAAAILAHNHPSGITHPSQADRAITRRLSEALDLVDVRVLDHLILGHEPYSFAEHGEI